MSKVAFPLVPCLQLSYPFLHDPSIVYCAQAVQSTLSSSSGGTALYIDIDLMCPCEEVSSGSVYATILDHPLIFQIISHKHQF